VAIALGDLPKYLVLAPTATVRIEMRLDDPACEIDVALDNPRPGRSFVLLIGHPKGPFVQRVRLSGRARIHFDPESPGEYVMLLANPQREPLVIRLRGRGIPKPSSARRTRRRSPRSGRPRASRAKGRPTLKLPPRDPPKGAKLGTLPGT
jgi:hypothetical protein